MLAGGMDDKESDEARGSHSHCEGDFGPVAAFKSAVVVKGLPKTRSGKILRGVLQKIANGPITNCLELLRILLPSTWQLRRLNIDIPGHDFSRLH